MHSHVVCKLAPAWPYQRPGLWRRALSGLTPKVVAFVAVLLLIRGFSTEAENFLLAARSHDLDTWLARLFAGYWALVKQTTPMLVVIVATANLGPQSGWKRIAALAAAVVLSAGVGTLLRFGGMIIDGRDGALGAIAYVWPRYVLLGGMLTVVAELYRREAASNAAAQRCEIDRISSESEMTEARLQILQAQIEPHFLFNTLANVRRLYVEDHALGRTMLDSVMRYLEVALPEMRNGHWTLERDSQLIEAYLQIQRIRMGARLAFSIDVPSDLRTHRVPPMMLLTLVENAIKHGLNPALQGGLVRVMARALGDKLILTVADTGAGFASASGSGMGLANISGRLAAEFGDRAKLSLENNEFGGATALITLPLVQ